MGRRFFELCLRVFPLQDRFVLYRTFQKKIYILSLFVPSLTDKVLIIKRTSQFFWSLQFWPSQRSPYKLLLRWWVLKYLTFIRCYFQISFAIWRHQRFSKWAFCLNKDLTRLLSIETDIVFRVQLPSLLEFSVHPLVLKTLENYW